jgi:hypothetical protein
MSDNGVFNSFSTNRGTFGTKEFLDSKTEIILAMDNDSAGLQATKNIIQRLPDKNIKTLDLDVP